MYLIREYIRKEKAFMLYVLMTHLLSVYIFISLFEETINNAVRMAISSVLVDEIQGLSMPVANLVGCIVVISIHTAAVNV